MRAVLVLVSFGVALSAYAPDLITSLPGVADFDSLGYKQYSGYLNASQDGNIQLHYWFVESQGTPSSDPVVLWLNGGPGCSSLDGFLYEHGPLLVNEEGTELSDNPYAWNKLANMIYLESPACVGFSYANDNNCTIDDDGTAEENYLALLSFFAKFPEFAGNSFYVTGESYGGVYVPTLTYKIFSTQNNINLKGFATGNGLLSNPNNTNTLIDFGYAHGMISDAMHDNLLSLCCKDEGAHCRYTSGSAKCKVQVAKAMSILYNPNVNIYDVIGTCYHGSNSSLAKGAIVKDILTRNLILDTLPHSITKLMHPALTRPRSSPSDTPIVPCINADGATTYLQTASVREALHIPSGVQPWEICSLDINYDKTTSTVAPEFHALIDGGIQAMVYNGDVDAACNILGNALFITQLGYEPTTSYGSWYLGQQIGGWTRSYGDHFQFITVRGAGHMVPQYKPRAALEMFYGFLQNNYVTLGSQFEEF